MVNRRERDTKFNNKSLKFQFLTHFHISGFYDAHKKRRQGCLCTMANTEVDDLCNHKAACLDYFLQNQMEGGMACLCCACTVICLSDVYFKGVNQSGGQLKGSANPTVENVRTHTHVWCALQLHFS